MNNNYDNRTERQLIILIINKDSDTADVWAAKQRE